MVEVTIANGGILRIGTLATNKLKNKQQHLAYAATLPPTAQ